MTSDDASEESEFLSALTASAESFVHKAFKDEPIQCIHRIVCHGRDDLAVLPTGLGKSARNKLISKGPYSQRHIKNRRRTPCFLLAYKVERYLHQVLLLKLTHYERNRRTSFTKYTVFLSAILYSTSCKFTLFVPRVIPAHDATSGNFAWFILIWRWHRRHSR